MIERTGAYPNNVNSVTESTLRDQIDDLSRKIDGFGIQRQLEAEIATSKPAQATCLISTLKPKVNVPTFNAESQDVRDVLDNLKRLCDLAGPESYSSIVLDFLNRPSFTDYMIDADPAVFQPENFERLERELISIYGTGNDYMTYNNARQHPGEHEKVFLGRLTRLLKRKRNVKTLNEADMQELTDKFILSLSDRNIARKLLEHRDEIDYDTVAERARRFRIARHLVQENDTQAEQVYFNQCDEEHADYYYDDDNCNNFDDYYDCDCDDDACDCADYDDYNVEDENQNYSFYTDNGESDQENYYDYDDNDAEDDNCSNCDDNNYEHYEDTTCSNENYDSGAENKAHYAEEFHDYLKDLYYQ